VDGRRHLERGEPGADDPTVAVFGERALLHEHAHQLADEERVALAGREHAAGERGRQLGRSDDVGREPRRRARVEAASVTNVGNDRARRHEGRVQIAELGPRAHQHEERHAGAPLHQVLDEIEKQRLGPVVVDHQHDRPRRSHWRETGARRRTSPGDATASRSTPRSRPTRARSPSSAAEGPPRRPARRRLPHRRRGQEPAEHLRERRERGTPAASQCAARIVASSACRRPSRRPSGLEPRRPE
jgi:hypothetical protein